MADYHVVLGTITALLAVAAYVFYFRSIFLGETKPHVFTWISYALIDGAVFFIQMSEGGGPGAWILGVAAAMNTLIAVLALWRGEKDIRAVDWACFSGALIGIVFWLGMDNPLGAVIVLTITNTLAIIPTFRKSFLRPHEESITIWALDVVKFSLSIVALESRTLTTVLFPAAIAVTNAILTVMIVIRRKQLARTLTLPRQS